MKYEFDDKILFRISAVLLCTSDVKYIVGLTIILPNLWIYRILLVNPDDILEYANRDVLYAFTPALIYLVILLYILVDKLV